MVPNILGTGLLLAVKGIDPILSGIVILSLCIVLIGLLLRRLNQPYIIAYIIAGVLLGPQGAGVIQNQDFISQIGELGIILLMFFIGGEIEVPNLAKYARKPLLVAVGQVVLSLLLVSLIGWYMSWEVPVIILLSFVISLSSSAVIFQYLIQNDEIKTSLGQLTTGVLLMQDIIIVPMLLVLNFLGKGELETFELLLSVLGSILILLFLRLVIRKEAIVLPFPNEIKADHDLQLFVGLLICFGFAWVTAAFGLSAALGAFIAGVVVAHSRSTEWLHQHLNPFRVFFLALFFVSIGLQIDLLFLKENLDIISLLVLLVFFINSLLNALIFRMLNVSMRDSVYAGALLSQIGEFSIVLCLVAKGLNLIGEYSYQITLSVIALSMLFTSGWIALIRAFIYQEPSHLKNIIRFIKK